MQHLLGYTFASRDSSPGYTPTDNPIQWFASTAQKCWQEHSMDTDQQTIMENTIKKFNDEQSSSFALQRQLTFSNKSVCPRQIYQCMLLDQDSICDTLTPAAQLVWESSIHKKTRETLWTLCCNLYLQEFCATHKSLAQVDSAQEDIKEVSKSSISSSTEQPPAPQSTRSSRASRFWARFQYLCCITAEQI